MPLSGYQIEKILRDFHKQQNLTQPSPSSLPDRLTLSEVAKQSAKNRNPNIETAPLEWITPQNILALIADTTACSPAVDYEQQRRAGQFVTPPWIPQNPMPAFQKVKDHRNLDPSSESPAKASSTAVVTPSPSNFVTLPPQNDSEIPQEASFELEPELDFGTEFELEPELDFEMEEMLLPESEIPLETETETEKEEQQIETEQPIEAEAAESEETEEEILLEEEEEPPPSASLLDLLGDLEDDDEEDDEGLSGITGNDSEVVFGTGRISTESMSVFVQTYADSALQFLFRRQLDGRPLPAGFLDIYDGWQERGLSRKRLKVYLLKVMDLSDFPDIPMHRLLQKLKDRLYDLREE